MHTVQALGVQPSSAWIAAFQEAALARLPSSGPQAMVEALLDMTKAGLVPSAGWLAALEARAQALLPQCNAQVREERYSAIECFIMHECSFARRRCCRSATRRCATTSTAWLTACCSVE